MNAPGPLRRLSRGAATAGAVGRHVPASPPAVPSPSAPAPSAPSLSAVDELFGAIRRRRRRVLLVLSVLVLLPTLLTAAYLFLVASPRYVSHAELTYGVYRSPGSLSAGLAQSFAGTDQNNDIDLGAIVVEYVRSHAIVSAVGRDVPLRALFSDRRLDPLSRLPPDASDAGLLRAWRRRVSVSEGLGGYVSIDVSTADPILSLRLARAVVSACDRMVDAITARARDDEMRFAESEVSREEDRVRRARAALTRFQDEHGTQDPERAAGQLNGVVGTLEADLAAARAQLAASAPFLSGSAPAVRQLHARIDSLQQQLAAERARLAGGTGSTFSRLLDQYARLQLDEEFARTAYTQAEQGLSAARADAARRQNYLVPFVEPSLPDRPDRSGPIGTVAAVFLSALLAAAILSVLGGALRDGADP